MSNRSADRRESLRLHATIARDFGRAIVSGQYPPGHIFDGEIEASQQLDVSRSAYREAIKILSAKGLLSSKPKLGTSVSPRHEWHLLDPDVLEWICDGDPDIDLLNSLFELRMMVEPAAAADAAERRTKSDLEDMSDALELMRQHTLNSTTGRAADKQFHAALLKATRNPFVISLTSGVTAAVESVTKLKQRPGPLTRDPIPDHENVYKAIVAKDPAKARRKMSELIRLAQEDTVVRLRRPAKKRSRVRKSA